MGSRHPTNNFRGLPARPTEGSARRVAPRELVNITGRTPNGCHRAKLTPLTQMEAARPEADVEVHFPLLFLLLDPAERTV